VSTPAVNQDFGTSSTGMPDTTDAARAVASVWWLWLVTGFAWLIAALIILQFNSASVTTVSIVIGAMFAFAAVQQFVLAFVADSLRWLWMIFGALFAIASLVTFLNPAETFAGLADILGFAFLTVGVWWVVRSLLERDADTMWWLSLLSGILMIVMAFWTSGQLFIEKVYTLLVFAGAWAMMHGLTDIFRAFRIRSVKDEL
jgi:uncharacterized membrane protein HdeD (DUF308 family)